MLLLCQSKNLGELSIILRKYKYKVDFISGWNEGF